MYKDRKQAGQRLGDHVMDLQLANPIVLAIPRGGVVVGKYVASKINASLDIVMAKKIGAPYNPEFAVAAVDLDGYVTFPPGEHSYASSEYIQEKAQRVKTEIKERLEFLRQGKQALDVAGKEVVLVDDGLATGLTALSAIKYVRRHRPKRLILAVPVSPEETLRYLGRFVDDTICPHTPSPFYAVGQWYARFDQVTDQAVREILSLFQTQ